MKIKNTKWIVLKWIAYITLPFIIVFGLINIFVINEVDNNTTNSYEADSYYESEFFFDKMNTELVNMIIHSHDEAIHYYEPYEFVQINGEEYGVINHFYEVNESFDFAYVDHESKIIYANRDSIDTKNINESFVDGKYYYKKIDNDVESTIGSNFYFYGRDLENIDIYFSLDEVNYTSQYFWNNIWYDIVGNFFDIAIINIVISVLLIIFLLVSMFIGIGKSKDSNKIKTNLVDKLPLEVLGLISLISLYFVAISNDYYNIYMYIYNLEVIFIAIPIYVIIIIVLASVVRRIKSGSFFTNTLVYRFAKLVIKFFNTISDNVYIAIILFCLAFVNFLILAVGFNFFLFLIYVFIWFVIGKFIYKRYNMIMKIRNLISDVYENKEYKINENDYLDDYLEVVEKLDKISSGFNDALESKLVSERMKSELITNVSHDIKTPLTSIINYVDLLKKEKIKDKKVLEYIDVLSSKADRLKKLTEDLVELSKASSGNLKIDLSKLNLYELINQLNGEYSEKFGKSGLDVDFNFKNKNLFIKADTKYIYRVFDNLYSNALKYSMKNTRVYIDAFEKNDNVVIEIKNISKDKLNISKEELMQRFVRGEASRNSEGSGLGLSIVENLVGLQDGIFDITIDGDLFKVSIIFRKW